MATGAAFTPPMVPPPDLVRDPNVQVLDEAPPPAPFFGLPPLGGYETHGTRYERRPWEAPPAPAPRAAPEA
eukprot:7922099-Alexandrium_andersonii.AAC.1